MKFKSELKSATALPIVVAMAGLAITISATSVGMARPGAAPAENPVAVAAPAQAQAVQRLAMREKPSEGCSPCNPCAAANPCAAGGCGGCNPCNPCAAAGGCNPCAAANPCAAGGCGGCKPCGGCNPCAGGRSNADVSAEDARAAYASLLGKLEAAFDASAEPGAAEYRGWTNYSSAPYVSATHGGRLVNNYGNELAANYGKYEEAGTFTEGAIIAKDSISVAGGKTRIGPLFLMEKMQAGFNSDYGDWKYTLVRPNGKTMGVTNGKNSNGVQFCADCHIAVEDQDHMFFLPEEYRN